MRGSPVINPTSEAPGAADQPPIRPPGVPRRSGRGAFNPEATISGLDGRSSERRFMKKLRAELLTQIGGPPTAVERALIEQAVALALRLRAMDLRFLAGGQMSEHDSRTYLAWSGHYTRTVQRIGVMAPGKRPGASGTAGDADAWRRVKERREGAQKAAA